MNYSCRNIRCSGVDKFVGVQHTLGGELQLKHYLDEKEYEESTSPCFLVYRCSFCGTIKTRMNEAFNPLIKEANIPKRYAMK